MGSVWTCRPAEGSAVLFGMGAVQHAHLLIILQRSWVVCMEALRPCHVRLGDSHSSPLKAISRSLCEASGTSIHSSPPAVSKVCRQPLLSCHRVWQRVVDLKQALLHAGEPDMDQHAGSLPQQACAAGAAGSWHGFARLHQVSLYAHLTSGDSEHACSHLAAWQASTRHRVLRRLSFQQAPWVATSAMRRHLVSTPRQACVASAADSRRGGTLHARRQQVQSISAPGAAQPAAAAVGALQRPACPGRPARKPAPRNQPLSAASLTALPMHPSTAKHRLTVSTAPGSLVRRCRGDSWVHARNWVPRNRIAQVRPAHT